MKRLILVAITSFMPFVTYAGGATGGWGLVIEDHELSVRYIGKVENMSLLQASERTFSTIKEAQDSNVTLRLHNRVISGRILEPEFADAVSIETDDGSSVVIVNEAAVIEQPDIGED